MGWIDSFFGGFFFYKCDSVSFFICFSGWTWRKQQQQQQQQKPNQPYLHTVTCFYLSVLVTQSLMFLYITAVDRRAIIVAATTKLHVS